MTYALFADEWPMHMIRLRLDRSDRHLFTELLAHCTRNLTDGVIDVPLAMVTDHPEAESAAGRLIAAGLIAEHPDGYVIADEYLRHQRTKAQVDADREKNREYQEAYRERGRRHKEGDHRACTKGCPEQGKDLRKGLTKDLSKGVQSNPLLSNPSEIGEGEIGESRSADGAQERATASLLPDKPHVFADRDFTGRCRYCNLKRSAGDHQTEVPERIAEIAERIGAGGAWVNAQRHDHNGGWGDWVICGTGPDWSVEVMTEWEKLEVGPLAQVSVTLAVPPVAAEDDTETWLAFYAALSTLFDQIAPGATQVDSEGGWFDYSDGELTVWFFYDSEIPDAKSLSRKHLGTALDKAVSEHFREVVRRVADKHRKSEVAA